MLLFRRPLSRSDAMNNPINQTITIDSISVVPGTSTVTLGYSNITGDASEAVGQGPALVTYALGASVSAAGWVVVGAVAMPPLPKDITWTVRKNTSGNQLVIADAATVADELDFHIQFIQSPGSTIYTSTDPVVINEPPK
jgi:hypothetical protein